MDMSYEARRRRQIVGAYVQGGEVPPTAPAASTHIVTHNTNEERFRGSEDECWKYIFHRATGSVDWAMRHEGWAITPIPAEEGS